MIYDETKQAFMELFKENSSFRKVMSLVVVCSISKVEGKSIDTIGDEKIADTICSAIFDNKPKGVDITVQCCEHLNRAVIVEREYMRVNNLEEVNVLPVNEAGGTFAFIAYKYFKDPVVVERVKVDGGMDIGLNMCGMHLKEVAQPLALEHKKIGGAIIIVARTRLKLIGGNRSVYK